MNPMERTFNMMQQISVLTQSTRRRRLLKIIHLVKFFKGRSRNILLTIPINKLMTSGWWVLNHNQISLIRDWKYFQLLFDYHPKINWKKWYSIDFWPIFLKCCYKINTQSHQSFTVMYPSEHISLKCFSSFWSSVWLFSYIFTSLKQIQSSIQ